MYIYIGILFAVLFFFIFAIILPLLPKGRIFLHNQLGRKDTVFGNFFGELQEAIEERDFETGDMGLLAVVMLIWSVLVCMVSLLIIGIYPIVILYSLMILIINKQTNFKK